MIHVPISIGKILWISLMPSTETPSSIADVETIMKILYLLDFQKVL